MSKAWQVAKVMLIEIRRDRAAWVSMLLVPILLTMIMGLIFGGMGSENEKAKVPVIDHDQTKYSKLLVEELKKEQTFKVTKGTEAKVREDISEGTISAAIIIPEGFGEALRKKEKTKLEYLQLVGSDRAIGIAQILDGLAIRFSTDSESASATLELMKQYGPLTEDEEDFWSSSFEVADDAWDDPPVIVEVNDVVESEVRGDKTLASGFALTSMGFTIMFIMFMVVSGATTLLEERQKKTLGRLLTSPTKKASIVGGKILGVFIIGGIQAAILILVGGFVFKVDWGYAPLPLVVLMAVFIFCMAAMGILVSALARTLAQANSITPVIIISLAMLGGCYWPVEITPPFMQTIAKVIPTGWMMKGLTDLMVRHRGWDAVLLPSLVILGFGIVFITIGLVFLRFE